MASHTIFVHPRVGYAVPSNYPFDTPSNVATLAAYGGVSGTQFARRAFIGTSGRGWAFLLFVPADSITVTIAAHGRRNDTSGAESTAAFQFVGRSGSSTFGTVQNVEYDIQSVSEETPTRVPLFTGACSLVGLTPGSREFALVRDVTLDVDQDQFLCAGVEFTFTT